MNFHFLGESHRCPMASLMIMKLLAALIHLSLAPRFLPVIVPALNLASASCQVKGTMGRKEEDTEMVERAVTHRPLSGCNPTILEHLHVYTNTPSRTNLFEIHGFLLLGFKKVFLIQLAFMKARYPMDCSQQTLIKVLLSKWRSCGILVRRK